MALYLTTLILFYESQLKWSYCLQNKYQTHCLYKFLLPDRFGGPDDLLVTNMFINPFKKCQCSYTVQLLTVSYTKQHRKNGPCMYVKIRQEVFFSYGLLLDLWK